MELLAEVIDLQADIVIQVPSLFTLETLGILRVLDTAIRLRLPLAAAIGKIEPSVAGLAGAIEHIVSITVLAD